MDNRDFPQSNARLGAPQGMSAEECHSLPVLHLDDVFISAWQPTGAEVDLINKGHPVWLSVYGNGHPPVYLSAEPPFVTDGEDYTPRPKRIFVCSPLRGNSPEQMEENRARAEAYCAEIARNGLLPLAPHVYFTRFLNDADWCDRERGCSLGIELLRICDELWVFTHDERNLSEGMQAEVDEANRLGLPIKSGHHALETLRRKD